MTAARLMVLLTMLAAGALAGPRLECREAAWDFGVEPNHREVEHVFRLRNGGDAPLAIGRVRVCCGATYALETNALPPGGEAELKIRLSLAGRLGPQDKSVHVISNDPGNPYFPLRLTGVVTAELAAEPGRLDFGNLEEGSAVERSFRVVSTTGGVFRVTGVEAAAWVRAVWEPEAGQTAGVLRVATKPPLPGGALAGRVVLLTDRPAAPRVELPVAARVDSEVVVVPAALAIRPGGDPAAVRYVAIRRRDGKAFRLLEVEAPVRSVKAVVSGFGENGYRIAVSGLGSGAGLAGKALILHTDMEGMEEIEVPLRLEVPRE